MSSTTHRAFLGDRERAFTLTPALIAELERSTGAGIGGLARRIPALDYKLHEITEIIRLGLIGGGEHPKAAEALVSTYVVGRPVSETWNVALGIITATMFGEPDPVVQDAPAMPADAAA